MKKEETRGRKPKLDVKRDIRRHLRLTQDESNNLDKARVILEQQTGRKLSIADTIALMSETILLPQNQQ